MVVCSIPCSQSVSSALPEVTKRDVLKVYGVLKGPRGNVKLERSGGLDYLVEGQRFFPALLTPGSVDGGYCRVDNVDIEHLRGGYLEFDPGCTTYRSMTMRRRQHR